MKSKSRLIISLIFLVAFILIAFNINALSQADNSVNLFFSNLDNSFLVNLSKVISYLFEPLNVIILSFLVSLLLFIKKHKSDSIVFTLSMLMSGELIYILKETVQRARPENALILESSASFPSGHALASLVFFGFFIYFSLKNLKSKTCKTILSIVLIMIILVIGISRLILNVHWASDVLGGWLLGLSILFASISIIKKQSASVSNS